MDIISGNKEMAQIVVGGMNRWTPYATHQSFKARKDANALPLQTRNNA